MQDKTTSGRIDDQTADKLSTISGLTRTDLIERWIAVHGSHPPKSMSRRLLEYSAVYYLLAKAFGGLKPAVRRKLRRGASTKSKKTETATARRGSRRLSPGARLVREWHGRSHTVEVVDSGFRYEGATYRSLSRIAQIITGARWSGPRFFGL